MPTEFILVHGTWSDGESFALATSHFVKMMAKVIGEDVVVSRFSWSGRNSVSARELASSKFRAFVADRRLQAPANRRVVIAHSHGGSVAMAALAKEIDDPPIDALVCIGTPFLHVNRLTEVEPATPPPLMPVAAAFAMVAALYLVWLFAFGSHHIEVLLSALAGALAWIVAHPLLSVASAIGAFLLFVLVIVVAWIHGNRERRRRGLGPIDPWSLIDEEHAWRDELLAEPTDAVWKLKMRCELPRKEVVPTLLIKVPGDEAHGALAAAQIALWVVHVVYGGPLRAITAAALAVKKLEQNVYLSGVLAYLCLWLPMRVLLWLLAVWLRALLSMPTIVLTAILSVPFGIEVSRVAGRVAIAPGDAPPGDWRVVYVAPFDRSEARRERADQYLDAGDDLLWLSEIEGELLEQWALATRGIAHSRAYSDPRVARILAEFIARLPNHVTADVKR